jgi:glycosyltransferase involved in cell wall biosynthesis
MKISIITPTLNSEKDIESCILNVANQNYKNVEHIIVDGLSTDSTLNIVKKYAKKYPHIKWISEKDSGVYEAMNKGIKIAEGEWIYFLGSDDSFYSEQVLGKISQIIKKADLDVIYGNVQWGEMEKKYDGEFSVLKLMKQNICHQSMFFKRDIFKKFGKFQTKYRVLADYVFNMQWFNDWEVKRYYASLVVAKYGTDGFSSKNQDQQFLKDREWIIKKYFPKEYVEFERELNNYTKEQKQELDMLKVHSDKQGEIMAHLERGQKIKNQQIAEQKQSLSKKNQQITKQKQSLSIKNQQIAEQKQSLSKKNQQIAEQKQILSQKDQQITLMESSKFWKLRGYYLNIKKIFYKEAFLGKIKNRYSKMRNFKIKHFQEALREARRVLKNKGIKRFLWCLPRYLVYGKEYFNNTTTQQLSKYDAWIRENENWDTNKILKEIKKQIIQFNYKPKISILTPVYNVEPWLLDECVNSVIAQSYKEWELCLCDDGSTKKETKKCLQRWAQKDPRIKVIFAKINQGISSATNKALKESTGEFIALLDNDDLLTSHALYENVKLLNRFPETDYIYSDEDKLEKTGEGVWKRANPFFKPDWDSQLLFACMYTCHLSVYRKKIVESAGGFRSEFDFSQDYDLALRVTERTNKIRHIPKILYHWRAIPGSAAMGGKDYARESNIKALEDAVKRRNYNAKVLEYPFANRVLFKANKEQFVSVIIPSDNERNIKNCINLIVKNTNYPNYEIIVVTCSKIIKKLTNNRWGGIVKFKAYNEPFNFSLKCNRGAEIALGEYLIFLNDDIEVEQKDWIENLTGPFGKGGVGTVSPKLFYENNTIQYAGMVTGVRGFTGTAFHTYPKDAYDYFNLIQSERTVSILSGACFCVSKEFFLSIGGFDSVNTPIMHSDVDLSFRIREKGLDLLYNPFVSLRHVGHLSLKKTDRKKKTLKDPADLYLLKKWGDYLSYDKYFPSNMKDYLYQGGEYHFKLMAQRQEEKMIKAKNILLISHDLSLSGAPIILFYLAKYLKSKGFFVTVMSPRNGEAMRLYRKANIPVVVDSTILLEPFSETKKFMANFDLAIVNTIIMGHMIPLLKELSVPVFWLIHESSAGLEYIKSKKEVINGFKLSDNVIFACKETNILYKDFLSNNVRIIANGIEDFGATSKKKKTQKESIFPLNIIHAGSIEKRKGQDILIESLRYIPKHLLKKFNISFVGRVLDRGYEQKIKQKAKQYNNVKFFDQAPLSKLRTMIRESDIFICSSRDEVFPLTILEAMAGSIPVISTNVGGIKSMINNGKEGFLIDGDNPKELAKSIIFFIKNTHLIREYGENGRKRFLDNFTVQKFGEKIVPMINKKFVKPS